MELLMSNHREHFKNNPMIVIGKTKLMNVMT